jgi:hypothetical protein
MDENDFETLTRCRASLEAEAIALFGIRQQGRDLTPQEWSRTFQIASACDTIDRILARRAERQRRADLAGGRSVEPPPPVIVVRRIVRRTRIRRRRTSVPLVARSRRGKGARRAAPAKEGGDPDPEPTSPVRPPLPAEGDRARILGRFVRSRAWALLTAAERRQIIALINGDLTPQAMAAVDAVFQQSALNRNEHPGPGTLWFGLPFPVHAILVRNAGGLFRVLAFDPDSNFADDWPVEGSA